MLLRPICLTIWKYLDPVYFSFTRLQYICPEKEEGIFRVRLTRYKGRTVALGDGTVIGKNDILLKIHFHNVKLLQDLDKTNNELSKGKVIFRQVMKSMPHLATFIVNHPEQAKIKGIIGMTLIDNGFTQLGFECALPKNKLYSSLKKLSQLPILLLSCSTISIKNIVLFIY